MTNSKALYYPSIEINDENWLKSTLLFWDEIKTIVPKSIENPYRNKTTEILAKKGVLIPEKVNPNHRIVNDLSNDILEYIKTEEGLRLFAPVDDYSKVYRDENFMLNFDKVNAKLSRLMQIHKDKFAEEFNYLIEDELRYGGEKWFLVNSIFGHYYMTLLANNICEEEGLSLLTDNPLSSNLSNKIKQGIGSVGQTNRNDKCAMLNKRMANGILTNLIIEKIDFHPSTNVIDILSFKADNGDALGLFRTNLKNLLEQVKPNANAKTLSQEVESVYQDEFLPSFNNLKKKLSRSPIKWTCDNFAKIGFFSVGTTAIPTYLLGLTVPHALLAGAGISLTASLISYNVEKKNILMENPYNYLLEIERNL